MHRDTDVESCPSERLGGARGYFPAMQIDDLLTEIEPKSESDRSAASATVAHKEIRYIDPLESLSVILDDNMDIFLVPLRPDPYHRIFRSAEFYRVGEEIADDLLELNTVDLSESEIWIDLVDEVNILMHARVYFIFRLE